ncbi:CDP-diacylglycerol--serine O-phosphatidyltransferase [Hymenobacter sp. UV11]|uniref:CDP-alcohol phosphatidyltransferase family protein n=1 Tax=Hymenobacter sp. UV11 TaxID=1849735 RepID=UPI00105E920B|nr:CDP-alcohol phosphatidyltransferase family protein [Hymenobacter sp. UV11]TDN37407.1 CDP-diacylglycerol--serine O-phosphatidyltransferase [Hymenobacter sp. UV11]TFZ68595.1 CDP-diacylglycerol--serine O-phosphatidyltransferase [Hymenobacter sp. UV11]
MKRHIPNAVTCLNLLCGCLALTFIFRGELVLGAYLVGAAAVADFFDGLLARALRVSSPIGKDLDSLADMVSFGVVPGAIMYKLVGTISGVSAVTVTGNADYSSALSLLPFCAFLIPIFSALRLAKFNNDTRQTTSFIGLPTPACTLVVASLPLILATNEFGLDRIILNPWLLLGLTVLLSGLLVAELPLFALKFKNLRWLGNRRRFIFVSLALVLVATLKAAGIPVAVLLYVLLSVPGRVRSRDAAEASATGPQ